jgi:predicted enzyme related to lactoylglutathione lyase
MANSITWVDIPVKNLNRAMKFYAAVLDLSLKKEEFPSFSIALIPHGSGEVGVCLFPATDDHQPSMNGPLLYLNCEGRLAEALEEVESLGGRILKGRHSVGEVGWRAIVQDPEGNRLALRSVEG